MRRALSWSALPRVENDSNATRASSNSDSAVAAVASAISTRSSSEGSGITAASANSSGSRPLGNSMRNAPETRFTPERGPMARSPARITAAVGWTAPAIEPSASPSATSRFANTSGFEADAPGRRFFRTAAARSRTSPSGRTLRTPGSAGPPTRTGRAKPASAIATAAS